MSSSRNDAPSTTFISAFRSLLTEEFDQVYTIYSPGGVSSVDKKDACVRAMEILRREVLHHLDALHSEQRLRLARDTRVNQLPADVLVRIFSLFPALELVIITHVCYYWRLLGFETPSLWTDVELGGECMDALRELLARSRAAPISIRLNRHRDCERPAAPDLIDAISPHMYRVRHLSIRPARNQLNLRSDTPISLLPGEMPPQPITLALPGDHQLRILHIDWNWELDGQLTIALRAPTSIVNASLQHLILRGVDFSAALWTPCTALRSLALDWPRDWQIAHISSIVLRNPLLRNLALYMLHNPWVSRTEWIEDGTPIVHDMDTLLLSGEHLETRELSLLLRRLSSPSLLYIVLDIEFIATSTLQEIIQNSLPHLQTIRFLDLRHCRRSLWEIPLFRLEDERGFQLIFPCTAMRLLLTLPCFDALRALRVDVKEWVDALNSRSDIQLLALEELYLVGTALHFGNRQRSVLCPRLVTVVIENTDAALHPLARPSYTYGSSHWTLAAAIVAVRLHGYQRPLRELVVVDSALVTNEAYETRHTGLFDSLILLNRGRFPSARLSSKPFEFIGDHEIASTF